MNELNRLIDGPALEDGNEYLTSKCNDCHHESDGLCLLYPPPQEDRGGHSQYAVVVIANDDGTIRWAQRACAQFHRKRLAP